MRLSVLAAADTHYARTEDLPVTAPPRGMQQRHLTRPAGSKHTDQARRREHLGGAPRTTTPLGVAAEAPSVEPAAPTHGRMPRSHHRAVGQIGVRPLVGPRAVPVIIQPLGV